MAIVLQGNATINTLVYSAVTNALNSSHNYFLAYLDFELTANATGTNQDFYQTHLALGFLVDFSDSLNAVVIRMRCSTGNKDINLPAVAGRYVVAVVYDKALGEVRFYAKQPADASPVLVGTSSAVGTLVTGSNQLSKFFGSEDDGDDRTVHSDGYWINPSAGVVSAFEAEIQTYAGGGGGHFTTAPQFGTDFGFGSGSGTPVTSVSGTYGVATLTQTTGPSSVDNYIYLTALPIGWKTTAGSELLDSSGTLVANLTLGQVVFRSTWYSNDDVILDTNSVSVDEMGLITFPTASIGVLGTSFDVQIKHGNNYWLLENQSVTSLGV
jgi:hypothetical protein